MWLSLCSRLIVTYSYLHLSQVHLMPLCFHPHLIVLCPSILSHPFHWYCKTFDNHHSDFGITSLLIHLTCCASMPHGSPFSFIQQSLSLFASCWHHLYYHSWLIQPCAHGLSLDGWGFSHALCLIHRHAPIFTSFSHFSDQILVLLMHFDRTLSVVAQPHLSVPQTPSFVHTSCFAPHISHVFPSIKHLSSRNFCLTFTHFDIHSSHILTSSYFQPFTLDTGPFV